MPKSPEKDKEGKKKLTKKEKKLLEQKKREEEERLRKEEEERRRAEEEKERLRREAEEKKRREEEERRLALERERINGEAVEFVKTVPPREAALQQRKETVAAAEEWKRFVKCSDLPDVNDRADMNAYLTIWRDNVSDDGSRNLQEDFADCERTLRLQRIVDARTFEAKFWGEEAQLRELQDHYTRVGQAITDTFDDMTAYIMQSSDELLNYPDDSQYTRDGKSVRYGLWMNLAKKRMKEVEFKGIGTTTELALQGMTQKQIALRTIHLNFDILSLRSQAAQRFYPIGGIAFIEILEMPRKAMVKKDWKIKEITELTKTVKRQPYKEQSVQGTEIEPPVTHVTFVIPDNIVVREACAYAAWWDEEKQIWSVDGIADVRFNLEERRVLFGTKHLSTAVALVQSRTFDIPYDSWSYSPLPEYGKSCGVFNVRLRVHVPPQEKHAPAEPVVGKVATPADVVNDHQSHEEQNPEHQEPPVVEDISILIYEDKCRLLRPNRPELERLNRDFFEPVALLRRLAESGYNLILEDSDAQFAEDVKPKVQELEKKAYEEMSLVSGLCAMAQSKWNRSSATTAQGVIRVANDLVDPRSIAFTHEMDYDMHTVDVDEELVDLNDMSLWSTMLLEPAKTGFVDCTEHSDIFTTRTPAGLDTHLNIYTCMQEKMGSAEAIQEMVDASDMLLCETVKKLFLLIRPLSWS